MQVMLKLKKKKKAEITYLEANKQQRRYRLTYLEISKKRKKYDWYFEGQRTRWKVNVTFLAAINKQIRCGLCIYSVNYNRKVVLGVQVEMKKKW